MNHLEKETGTMLLLLLHTSTSPSPRGDGMKSKTFLETHLSPWDLLSTVANIFFSLPHSIPTYETCPRIKRCCVGEKNTVCVFFNPLLLSFSYFSFWKCPHFCFCLMPGGWIPLFRVLGTDGGGREGKEPDASEYTINRRAQKDALVCTSIYLKTQHESLYCTYKLSLHFRTKC